MDQIGAVWRLLGSAAWNIPIDNLTELVKINGNYLGLYHLQNWQREGYWRLDRAFRRLGKEKKFSSRDYSLRGRLAYLSGELAKADRFFNLSLEARPTCRRTLAWRGLAHLGTASHDRGVADLKRAARGSTWAWPHIWLGRAMLLSGDFVAAQDCESLAIKLDGKNASAYFLRGVARKGLKSLGKARADFEAAADAAPRIPGFWIALGRARADVGDERGALEAFNAATLCHHDCMDSYFYLLSGLSLKERLKDINRLDLGTRAALDRRISEDSSCWWAFALRGSFGQGFGEGSGNNRRREADLRRAAALCPSSAWVRAQMARFLWTTRTAEALDWMKGAVRLSPRCGWMISWRGGLHILLGDNTNALRDFNLSLKLDPFYSLAYEWRGSLHMRRKRLREAESDLNGAAILHPKRAYVFYQRSQLRLLQGRLLEAVQDCTRSVCLQPEVPRTLARDSSKRASVARSLEALAKEYPNEPLILFWLGKTFLELKRPAAAVSCLDRFIGMVSANLDSSQQAMLLLGRARDWRSEAVR